MRCFLICILALSLPAMAQTSAQSSSDSQASSSNTVAPQQSITYNTNSSGTLRTTPSVFSPSMVPTTPCTSVISAGVAAAGFGLSLGGNYEDKNCTTRELARVLHQMGYPDAGLAIMCGSEEVRTAAPQLCKRATYVMGRGDDYISNEKPPMPPAPVQSRPAPVPVSPAPGQTGWGTDGRMYRFNGTIWVLDGGGRSPMEQGVIEGQRKGEPR